MSFYGEREKNILSKAERIVFEQIENITADNDINMQELEILDKLVDIIKDIKEACVMDGTNSGLDYSGNSYARNGGNNRGGYSQHMPYMGWGYPHDGMSFGQVMDGGMSYNNGMGYNGNGMNSYRGGMQNGGYSRDDYKQRLKTELQRAIEEATTEKERNAIMQCMNAMEW